MVSNTRYRNLESLSPLTTQLRLARNHLSHFDTKKGSRPLFLFVFGQKFIFRSGLTLTENSQHIRYSTKTESTTVGNFQGLLAPEYSSNRISFLQQSYIFDVSSYKVDVNQSGPRIKFLHTIVTRQTGYSALKALFGVFLNPARKHQLDIQSGGS